MPTKTNITRTTRSANKLKPAKGKKPGKAKPKAEPDHDNPWASAGAELSAIRSNAQVTQVTVAERSGMGQNRVSAAEKSDNLTWQTMNKVASACRSKNAPQGYGFMRIPRHLMKRIELSAKGAGLSTDAWFAKQLGRK